MRLGGRSRPAIVLIVAGLAAATPIASGLGAQTVPVRRSFDLRVPVAPTPVRVGGTLQLVYELHLANFAREPLAVRRVEVLDADGAVIADVRGNDLDGRLLSGARASRGGRPASAPEEELRVVAPGMHAVLYLEIPLDDDVRPRSLEHRVEYAGVDETSGRSAVVQGAPIPVAAEPAVTLAPPLRGGPWAAVYHPSWASGHRRVIYATAGSARIPGRFAVDFVKLDANGRRARGDVDRVANWFGHGAAVLAVADGVVAATRDDVAESATLSDQPQHPLEDGAGNYVTLDLGGARFAFYEHLAPGSIRVQPGERVTRGQAIAAVGFTGHSMGPHLHFHVADASSSLDAEGLPFVLERFDVLGAYDGFEVLDDVPWTPLGSATRARRTGELPAPNAVIDFATSDDR